MRGNIKRATYRSFKGNRHSRNYLQGEKRKQKNAESRAFRRNYPPLVIRSTRAGKPLNYVGVKQEVEKMHSKKALWEICLQIYQDAFRASTPPGDFRKMMKTGEASTKDFYLKYYLPTEKLQAIMDRHCKKNKLTKYERGQISMEIFLGCSPSGSTPEEREKFKQRLESSCKRPMFSRRPDGRIEWICEHGVGHSDKEQAKLHPEIQTGVHGCCQESCCTKPEFEHGVWIEKLKYDMAMCANVMKRHGMKIEFEKAK